jgi:predicted permease
VSPRYFQTLGIPLRAGRGFTLADRDGAVLVAIVDETAALALFPGESALGRRISVGDPDRASEFEIVGVVGVARNVSIREAMRPTVYLSIFQGDRPWMPTLLVRTQPGAKPPIDAVLKEFQALDKDLPVFNVKTLDRQVSAAMARERLVATLSAFFAALAALLVAIGLYGILAHSVARRTREIGIRMALGAPRARVVGLVVRESVVPVAVGLALGLFLTRAATAWAGSLLFGLTPFDPAALTLAVVSLLAVAAAASYFPARRACQVDPTMALRYE